jgi:hypothetical protein
MAVIRVMATTTATRKIATEECDAATTWAELVPPWD